MSKTGISFFFAAAVIFFASSQGVFTRFENALTEWRFKVATRAPTGGVVLVEIGAESLAASGDWPLPRAVYGRLIDRLTEMGAAEIALNADFSEPSTPEDDAALEAALKRAGGGVVLTFSGPDEGYVAAGAVIPAKRPLERFATRAWGAADTFVPDSDGRVRRMALQQDVDGVPIPSLPALLGGETGVTEGMFVVDFGINADEIDRIPAIDILTGRLDPRRVDNRKIVIGGGRVVSGNTIKVPVYGKLSGPLLHILATETILQNRKLFMTGPIPGGIGLGVLVLVAIFLMRRYRAPTTVLILAVTSTGLEAMAIAVQSLVPIIIETSQWHIGLLVFGATALAGERSASEFPGPPGRRDRQDFTNVAARVIFDNIDGVIVMDEDARVRLASKVAAEILQLGDYDLAQGVPVKSLVPAQMAAGINEVFAALKDGGNVVTPPAGECELVPLSGGKCRILEFAVTPSSPDGRAALAGMAAEYPVVCLTFRDITEKRRAEECLEYLARNDPLTGLANRYEYRQRLDLAISDPGGDAALGAVLVFNLDRFRNINETLGHRTGDILIQAVAHRVEKLLGKSDTLARFGGDDFAVLLTGPASRSAAGRLADRIIGAVRVPMALGRHRIVVGTSVGIALIHDGCIDGDQLIADADTALLRAKSAGGGARRFFDPQMATEIRNRREIELDLWRGFDRGEFEVHYQPQVLLKSREINGVEALVRWRHPARGYIPPAVFIPLAESTGLIEPLGALVLREACAEVASWPVPLNVAVNLSAVQFQRGDLVASVQAALDISGLPAQRLELEITESLFMQDSGATEDILARLLEMKLRFALDDFGTGYSSLSYIRKFPISKIKIDRAFVRGLPGDRDSLSIIGAVHTLAENLGLTTSVEGIETEDQARILTRLGCTQGQGYFFGRPQTGAELAGLLQSPHRIKTDAA